MVFLYQPVPISLKPRADRRLLMFAAAFELSGFSSADGVTQGCDIWKSWGTLMCSASLNDASRLNVQSKFSVSTVRCAIAPVAINSATDSSEIIRFIEMLVCLWGKGTKKITINNGLFSFFCIFAGKYSNYNEKTDSYTMDCCL